MPVYNLCRICLTEDTNTRGMRPLFEEKDERCAEIVQRIEMCGGIVLKPHAEFPRMICSQCLDSLNTSYKFRTLCQASEHALLDAIVKSEMKTEPQERSTSPLEEDAHADSENEIFFDLRTEFIDAQEVNLEDITENVKHISTDEEDSTAEYIACSDVEYEPVPKKQPKRKLPPRKKSSLKMRTAHKRGRPRLHGQAPTSAKPDLQLNKKSGRGRKKIEAVEMASIMCEICGNIYSKRSLLNMHMRRHMAEKPFECEICGKTFACPSEIGRHMRVHTGEKPYVCRFCGRSFADRSSNIKHERIHTNERPFTCQTCGKSFTYSNVLKNHMLTHTGEKPFSCIPCNKTFSRKHQLDQHCGTITHQQTVKNIDGIVKVTKDSVNVLLPTQDMEEDILSGTE